MPDKPKVTFIHVAKTAGTSLRKMLEPQTDFEWVCHTKMEEPRPDSTVMMAVRNPYDRLHDLYHFSRAHRMAPFDKYVTQVIPRSARAHGTLPDTGFIRQVMERKRKQREALGLKERKHFTKVMSPCVDHVGDLDWVDHIIRFEHLEEDTREFCDALGLTYDLKHLNKMKNKPPFSMDLFTPEMLDAVNKTFLDDFINFGYEMVEP